MLYTEPAWVSERAAEIERIIARYPVKRSAIMPLLHLAQEVRGYVSDDDIVAIAQLLEETPAYVESVCSFYSMYHRRPKGKYHLVVCGNLSCGLLGSQRLIRALEETLGIKAGETTPDGLVSLEVTAECLAACDQAPCLQCNVEYVTRCTPEKGVELARALLRGEGPDRFIEFPLPAVPAAAPAPAAPAARQPAGAPAQEGGEANGG